MILPRALSCAVLLLLLLAVLGRGKRCSIARILRQYRAVIFHEIQNLKNLSGSAERSSRAGLACRSDKDQKILLAIYNISMSLRDVAGGTLRGPEEVAVWKVARNTEFVLRENCRRIGKSPPRAPVQPRWEEEAAEGDLQEGAAAGDVLGEALRPARPPPGLLGVPSPPPRSAFVPDAAWFLGPGGNSTPKSAKEVPGGARI
nr:uncharacterized protein C20orf204 homolog isoform X2 [Anas platyrhynchos]